VAELLRQVGIRSGQSRSTTLFQLVIDLPAGNAMTPQRVLIVDDDDLMRAWLRAVLSSNETIEVVAEAADGYEAVGGTRATQPDVVLMDVRMPNLDGIAAIRKKVSAAPDTKILVLTTFEDDDHIFGALSAGVSDFLLKRTQARAAHRRHPPRSPAASRCYPRPSPVP
jgi:chemotaxis response regulator CheB